MPAQPDLDGHYWERTRRGAAPWVIGAVGLAALGWGQLVPVRHHLESDLRTRSLGALRDAGLTGVTVDFTGRDGRLTVSSPADVDRALGAVRGLRGVRVVTADLHRPGSPAAGPTPSAGPTPTPSATPTTSATPTATASATPTPSAGPTPAAGSVQASLNGLPQITFGTGSTALTLGGRAVVLQAAAILRATPTLGVTVEGYTDDLGDWDVNKQLSTARAEAVRQTLIAAGVAADRLTVFGWSEDHPAVPNTTPANRALNRRVGFTVH